MILLLSLSSETLHMLRHSNKTWRTLFGTENPHYESVLTLIFIVVSNFSSFLPLRLIAL